MQKHRQWNTSCIIAAPRFAFIKNNATQGLLIHNQYEQCLATAKRIKRCDNSQNSGSIGWSLWHLRAHSWPNVSSLAYVKIHHTDAITNASTRNPKLASFWDATAKMLCMPRYRWLAQERHSYLSTVKTRAMKSGTVKYNRDHSSDSSLAARSSSRSYFVHNHKYSHHALWFITLPMKHTARLPPNHTQHHVLTKHCPEHSFKPSLAHTKSTVKKNCKV